MGILTQDQAREEWWHTFGVNLVITNGTEDICLSGDLLLPAAAAATTIVSASADDDGDPAGTGVRTVKVTGLVAGGGVVSEVATLNGTGAVTLGNSYLRILDAYTATAGSGGVAAGQIDIKHSATIIGTIDIGTNKLNRCAYTVPAAKRGRIQAWRCATGIAVDGVINFKLQVRPSGGAWQILDAVELADVTPGFPYQRTIPGGYLCEALTDIKVTATTAATSMDGWAGIDGTLEPAY
jgi:hypothetical protein